MIKSFGDKETELIYNQVKSKKLPYEIQERALIKLILIDAAESENDLRSPPANKLEKLKGKLNDHWSIRINQQWHIIFKFHAGDAYGVTIVAYH